MPYISENKRSFYDYVFERLTYIRDKGELEYCIFKLMKIYMKDKDFKYSNLHDTVYAAQHCADEFRRRFLDIREDDALKTNGDISS